MHCGHEALSPYTRDGPGGPTKTTSTQDRFAKRLRGVLRRINARIREAIIKDDLFGLRDEALVDDVPEDVFEIDSRRRTMLAFIRWLKDQLDNDFLRIVGEDRNEFIDTAYAAGIRNVHSQLRDLDVAFERPDVNEVIGGSIHQAALRTLYSRVYENLVSVRDDVANAVRDTLLEGFEEGHSPTKIARSLTGRVNSIGKHRATMIARSEVMNAHSDGTLSRVEEINRDRPRQNDQLVTGHGQWDAAIGQPNTCAFCRRMNGVDLRVREMRKKRVQFRGQVYRLMPPAHVNGRCNIGVRVGGRIDTPLSDRLPAEVTLVN